MKTVFSNSMVAHTWAHNTDPKREGRNSSKSFWFDGATLYSYATPIGQIVPTVDGRRVALITDYKYSMATAKQICDAHRACRDVLDVFTVPFIATESRGQYRVPTEFDGTPWGSYERWQALHAANLAALTDNYAKLLARFMRAQVASLPSSVQLTIAERMPLDSARLANYYDGNLYPAADYAVKYAAAFGLVSAFFDVDSDARKVAERFVRLVSDPKRAARLEKERATRVEREAARVERERVRVAEHTARAMEAWFAGGHSTYRVSDANGNALLRLSKDGSTVQTSWGAEVPRADVERALRFYRSVVARGDEWFLTNIDDANARLGQFHLSAINANGNVRAGCHTFSADEIKRFAALLNA